MANETISVGGVPFRVSTLPEAATWLTQQVRAKRGVPVRLANAYCVALANEDPAYGALLTGNGVNFPDGAPVVWSMRLASPRPRGQRKPSRVRGPSFFRLGLQALEDSGSTNFFIGGAPGEEDRFVAIVAEQFPELKVAGVFSPAYAPLSEEFLDECVERARKAKPQIVWVGLGTPKQDFVAREISARLEIPAVGVGAAFDFLSGAAKEAPRLIQRSGLEWLFRLSREPRRLWRRYLIGNGQFLIAVAVGLVAQLREHRGRKKSSS